MKKAAVFVMAVLLSVSVSVSASAAERTLAVKDISSSANIERTYADEFKVTELKKSRTIKKSELKVEAGEVLAVTRGVTLRLNAGADIRGGIYVTEGGKLILGGGEFTVNDGGYIFSDGTLTILKSAEACVKNGGEMIVGKSGTLDLRSDNSMNIDAAADTVCMGRNKSGTALFGTKAVAAYTYDKNGSKVLENPQDSIPDISEYHTLFIGNTDTNKKGGKLFVFDNGSTLRVKTLYDDIVYLGNMCVASVYCCIRERDEDEEFYSGTNYCLIYELNGGEYYADWFYGEQFNSAEIISSVKPADCKYLGKYTVKDDEYIPVKSGDYVCTMYLCPDGNIAAVEAGTEGSEFSEYNTIVFYAI